MMSPRTRELGFMVPAIALGLLGIGTVASARADTFDAGPWPAALGVVGVFLVMHLALRLRAPQADPYLLPIVGLLVAIGLVELDRVDPALAADQAAWVAVGGAVFVAVLFLLPDHRVLKRYRYLIGLTAVGLLVITMVFGTRIYGAKLWIEIGGGQTVQLGELSKVLLVIDSGFQTGGRLPTARAGGGVYGLWEEGGRVEMRHIPYDVNIDDKEVVVTSGKTAGIPEGLVVGKVMEIRKDQAQNETVVEVLPLVNFDNLESVTVITGTTAGQPAEQATPGT